MKRPTLITFIVLPFCAFLIVLGASAFAHYFYGADFSVLNPKGPVAFAERHILLLVVELCAIVVIPTFFTLFFFAWRYRADGPHARDAHSPNWDHDSIGAEFFWWLVPSAIILALAIVAWDSSYALDPYKPLASSSTPLTVEVIALQWKWLFIYPAQDIATVNELMIPAGAPVTFKITADAPMNSLWIPSLGGQIMAMPGMTTQLNLLANATGTFNGFSGNISGEGFAGMAFETHALTQADFNSWVASVRAGSPPLDERGYAAFAQPSMNLAPASYVLSDPTLFDDVVMSFMMPSAQSKP